MALSWVNMRVVKFQPDGRRLDERDRPTIFPTLFATDKVQKQTDGLIEDLIDGWIDELIDELKAE